MSFSIRRRRHRYRLRCASALTGYTQIGSSMQRSYTLLILCIPIFFLAAERQNLLRSRSCGHRHALFAVKLLARPENPHHGIFFSKSPPTEKVSANAGTDRTLRQTSMRSFLLFHKRHSAHAVPASRLCCSHRATTTSLHVQLGLGACLCHHTCAAMVSPTASQLCRQSHVFRAGPSSHAFPHSQHYAGQQPVHCGFTNVHPSAVQLRAR
jgi:hypothetical protein